MPQHAAEYWNPVPDGRIQCELCPHHCRIAEGHNGRCRVRGVREGKLQAFAYGLVSASHLDPIEKKPLYHFRPGTSIFSIGGWGCNFSCRFCQNWSISQQVEDTTPAHTPAQILKAAGRSGSDSIAYTYNEPLVGFEFVRDCAMLAHAAGMTNVLVTNGFVETEPAAALLPFIAAANVDIKSMDEEFYRTQCGGRLAPVLAFCAQARAAGCHLEITNLIIPSLNDDPAKIESLAQWVGSNLGPATPLHLSAYHPDFQCDAPATPSATLIAAHAICKRHLQHVYLGNVSGTAGQDTLCPGCNNMLINRHGYTVHIKGLKNGHCDRCGQKADILQAPV